MVIPQKKGGGGKGSTQFFHQGTPAIPCHAIFDICISALLLPGCRGSAVFVHVLFVFPEGWERGDFFLSKSWTNKQQTARETKTGREHLPGALCPLIRNTTICECTLPPPPPEHMLFCTHTHVTKYPLIYSCILHTVSKRWKYPLTIIMSPSGLSSPVLKLLSVEVIWRLSSCWFETRSQFTKWMLCCIQ